MRPARRAGGALLATLLAAGPASARLYSGAAGYQLTSGDGRYEGHEVWGVATVRLEGGWYPYGRLSAFRDSYYDRVAAPTLGVQKGLPGLGRARAAYTYYEGVQRQGSLRGQTHAAELAFYRAWAPKVSSEVLYRRLEGSLFAGSDAFFAPGAREPSFTPRQVVLHQAAAAASREIRLGLTLRLSASLSGVFTGSRKRTLAQTFGLAAPLAWGTWLQASTTLVQGVGPDRSFLGVGVYRDFSGR